MNAMGAARARMDATGARLWDATALPATNVMKTSPDCTLQRPARLEALKSLKNPNEPHAGR
jgi:hypothetical protein